MQRTSLRSNEPIFFTSKKKSSNSLHKVYVQARIEMFEKIFLYKRIFKIFKQYFYLSNKFQFA